MSGLIDKITSDFFEAQNALNKSKGIVIEVYVENEDDIPFWKDIFERCELQTKIHPASKTSLDRGKTEVLKQINDVGKMKILCVDSDYDYLLQGYTDVSKIVNDNPYVFQTYTYSIENFKCYAESLHGVVVKATLQDEQLFDYVGFLKSYSSIIYDLFIYSLHHEKEQSKSFTMADFSNTIKLLEQVDVSSSKQLKKLKESVEKKIATLDQISDKQISQFKEALQSLGVTPENTYLFIKGHTLYENVVCMFLKPIERYLRSKQFKQISELKKDDEEATDRRNQYKKSLIDIEFVLRHNTNYYDCFLMKKILSDIENYKTMNFSRSVGETS
jgi:hypothetical protein